MTEHRTELNVGVVTCSDSRAEGKADDEAGASLMSACEQMDWLVVAYHVCPDDAECIASSLIEICDGDEADVVFTLGGTGLGPRDITPEVTERICERIVPGMVSAIFMRAVAEDPAQMLSRATVGTRGRTLIVNLPGGVEPTMRTFKLLEDLLPAAVAELNQ